MTSPCPKCNTINEHDDFMFEVLCSSCGTRFNPFMDAGRAGEVDLGELADPAGGSEPRFEKNEDAGAFEEPEESLEVNLPEFTPEPADDNNPQEGAEMAPDTDFSESNTALEELRQFGETIPVGSEPEDTAKKAPPAPPAATPPAPEATGETGVPATTSGMVVTAGDSLPGYQVESYLSPVSVMARVSEKDPLLEAYEKLWEQTTSAGANAVVGVRWRLTPDGIKVLMSGTPVRCRKA